MRKFATLDKKEALDVLFRTAYRLINMNLFEALPVFYNMIDRVDMWNSCHNGEKILLTEMGVNPDGHPDFWLENDYFTLREVA